MSRTIEIQVYKVDELSDDAKETAYYKWLENHYYGWSNENEASLKAFAEEFGINVKDWSYGDYRQYVNWDWVHYDTPEELTGYRLAKYLINNHFDVLYKPKYIGSLKTNDEVFHKRIKTSGPFQNGNRHHAYYSAVFREQYGCPFTGYYIDNSLLHPIYEFLKSPNNDTNLEQLMAECLKEWANDCTKDYEHSTSMEYFMDESEANDWEYESNGRLV